MVQNEHSYDFGCQNEVQNRSKIIHFEVFVRKAVLESFLDSFWTHFWSIVGVMFDGNSCEILKVCETSAAAS